MIELPVKTVFYCSNCEADFDEAEANPGYECQQCGETWNRSSNDREGVKHRCPSCDAIGAKLSEHACRQCEAADELEERQIVICPICDDAVAFDEFKEEHLQNQHVDDLIDMYLSEIDFQEPEAKPAKKKGAR